MSALFYRAVIQVVLIFELESWVLSYVIMRLMEGSHVGFLRYITGNHARRQANGEWETPAEEEVLKLVGTKLEDEYIVH